MKMKLKKQLPEAKIFASSDSYFHFNERRNEFAKTQNAIKRLKRVCFEVLNPKEKLPWYNAKILGLEKGR